MSGLQKLGSIMEGFLKGTGTRNKIKSYLILDLWPQVIGSALEGKTEARAVKNGVLYVTCVSPPLAHQLSFMKRDMLKKIASLVGTGIIKDIRFQSGEIDVVHSQEKNAESGRGQSRAPQEWQDLDAQETALLEEMRQSETDPELQTAFLKAATTAKRVRKTRMQEGWQPCQRCGVLYDPNDPDYSNSRTTLCSVCEQQNSRKHVETVAEQLRLFPWKSYREMHHEHPELTQLEYRIARRDKLQQLGREINRITNTIMYANYQVQRAAGRMGSVRGRMQGSAQVQAQRQKPSAKIAERDLRKLRTLVLEYIMIYDAHIYQDLTHEKVSAVLGKHTAECLFS